MALSMQFENREDFEARTLRAIGGGALAGLLAAAAWRSGVRVDVEALMLGMAAWAGAWGGLGRWKQWLGVGAGLVGAMGVTELLALPSPLEEVTLGALAAGVVGVLGMGWRPKPWQVALGAVGAGALLPVGMYVREVLDARFFGGGTGLMGALVGGGVLGLFWSVGTLATHGVVHGDGVEALGAALEARLKGEAQTLVARTLKLYRQCCTEAARLEAGAGRTELLGALEKMARDTFALAETHAGLEGQLSSVVQGDVDAQVKELRARAEATEDAVARRQLELAASSLGEELNHLDALRRRKERLLAQFHAQVALLERARVSLVGAQGGDAAAKGAQAAQLAQRLSALAEEGHAALPADSTKVTG